MGKTVNGKYRMGEGEFKAYVRARVIEAIHLFPVFIFFEPKFEAETVVFTLALPPDKYQFKLHRRSIEDGVQNNYLLTRLSNFAQDIAASRPYDVTPAPPVTEPEKGVKADNGKLRYDLLPVRALAATVGVLTYGAKKYSDNNWKIVPDSEKRYISAAMRHIEAWRANQLFDEESGLPHLAHAICCLMFLIDQPGVPQSAAEDYEMHGRD